MTADHRRALPPFPDGWYAVAFSSELVDSAVLTRRLAGNELVLFRTSAGSPVVMAAHCPHLGAHLGLGGVIVEDCIRCPFHGFEFDGTGTCTATGYGTDVPKGLTTRVWRVHETDGVIFAWHDASGREPWFQLPELSADGWTRLETTMYTLRDHPQETTENAVDLGHFAWVHGYRSVELHDASFSDGAMFSTSYEAIRPVPVIGQVRFEFSPQIWGLGYSMVDLAIPDRHIASRLLVLATPTDPERLELRLATRTRKIDRPGRVHPLARAVPGGVLSDLVNRMILRTFGGDASADFTIWENKVYVDPPRLAVGDGPIGAYRKWARQFYSGAGDAGD